MYINIVYVNSEGVGEPRKIWRESVTQAVWDVRTVSPASVWRGKASLRRLRNHLEVTAVLQVRGWCGMRKKRAEVRERKGWEASADSLVPHI